MDIDTLSNFISKSGKADFEIACKIVLNEVFQLNAINVDGSYDGGTDYAVFNNEGKRNIAAYQITTQKTDVDKKAYRDAKKSVEKLHAKRFYFLCTYNYSEIECRTLENQIGNELDVTAIVYPPKIIAGLLMNSNKVGVFLDRIGYDDLHRFEKTRVDFKEMALHSYSFLSEDTRNLKNQIYDDALLLILSENEDGLCKEEIIDKVVELLCLPSTKESLLSNRLDTLKGKGKINNHPKDGTKLIAADDVLSDIKYRKILYDKELSDLAAAQIDIMNDYGVEWTIEDSQKASVWLASIYMRNQLVLLESANASLADGFLKRIDQNGYSNLKSYLIDKKKIAKEQVNELIDILVSNASTHPLMIKITSASVYIALEGTNPLISCKALGVSTWHDENMIVEPTIGIPFLCSLLYNGKVNTYFDNAIRSIDTAKKLGIGLFVPYYYIKECAGHLHMARLFDGLTLDPNEMRYSSNAFVSNYYALKQQGISMPESFIDYLATFSPSIRTEMKYKDWIRAIMNDIQSIFTRNGIVFQEIPHYSSDELKEEQTEYSFYLKENEIDKSDNLMLNDAITLHFTKERALKDDEHWMVLTYDRSLINVAHNIGSDTWVSTPFNFLNLTEMTKSISEKEFSSLIHSMASFSSKTLAIGARVLDRIIFFASDKMQNWEFQESIKHLKSELVNSVSEYDTNFLNEVDKRTNEFLKNHGVPVDLNQSDVDLSSEQL